MGVSRGQSPAQPSKAQESSFLKKRRKRVLSLSLLPTPGPGRKVPRSRHEIKVFWFFSKKNVFLPKTSRSHWIVRQRSLHRRAPCLACEHHQNPPEKRNLIARPCMQKCRQRTPCRRSPNAARTTSHMARIRHEIFAFPQHRIPRHGRLRGPEHNSYPGIGHNHVLI